MRCLGIWNDPVGVIGFSAIIAVNVIGFAIGFWLCDMAKKLID